MNTYHVTDDDHDVLHYVSGRLLHSAKSRIIKSCKKEDKSEAVLDILQCFNSEEDSDSGEEQSFINTNVGWGLGWGGLTDLKPSVVSMLAISESHFLKLCSGQKGPGDIFLKDCLASRILTSSFYEICYASEAEDEEKEFVLECLL